jgi:hypothetical protein
MELNSSDSYSWTAQTDFLIEADVRKKCQQSKAKIKKQSKDLLAETESA